MLVGLVVIAVVVVFVVVPLLIGRRLRRISASYRVPGRRLSWRWARRRAPADRRVSR